MWDEIKKLYNAVDTGMTPRVDKMLEEHKCKIKVYDMKNGIIRIDIKKEDI